MHLLILFKLLLKSYVTREANYRPLVLEETEKNNAMKKIRQGERKTDRQKETGKEQKEKQKIEKMTERRKKKQRDSKKKSKP